MTIAQQQSPAITMLSNFIATVQSRSIPDPQFFQGLKVLEVTLEQVQEEKDLKMVSEVLAQWINSVPRDFERPTFEQIIAHLTAITFSLNRKFLRVRLPLQISREGRPAALQNDLRFLQEFVVQTAMDRSIIPSADLQRGLVDMVAGLLKRAGVDIVDDQQMTPEEFCRLPLHRIVLELYKRRHQLGPEYKRGEASLEYQLTFHRLLEPLCQSTPVLLEFLGIRGLDIIRPESWWTRVRRRIRRWFIEWRLSAHESALYSEQMLIAILVLMNLLLFLALWNPMVHGAEIRIDQTKARIIESVLEQIRPGGRN